MLLPPGWVVVLHHASRRSYPTYHGPTGQRATSHIGMWRIHEAAVAHGPKETTTTTVDEAVASDHLKTHGPKETTTTTVGVVVKDVAKRFARHSSFFFLDFF